MRGLPKGRGGKGALKREEEEEEGDGVVTFEQCHQEVMTQFSTWAVKQRIKTCKQRGEMKTLGGKTMRQSKARRDKPVKDQRMGASRSSQLSKTRTGLALLMLLWHRSRAPTKLLFGIVPV